MKVRANVIKRFRILKDIFVCILLIQGYFREFLNIWRWLKKYLEVQEETVFIQSRFRI